jgi:Uma2 family endonuclease
MAITGGRTKYPHVEDGEPVPWVGQRMTLEEFVDLPEVKPYLEYDDGIVRQKMSPNFVHISLQEVLVTAINRVARSSRLGLARSELRIVTPGEWAPLPDVSFFRSGRIKRSQVLANEEIRILPDLAIEVASPGQSVTELIAKCVRYLALGTEVALIVDPAQEAVLGLRPDRPISVMRGDDQIDLGDLLPQFALTVRELFDAVTEDLKYLEGDEDAIGEPEREQLSDTRSPVSSRSWDGWASARPTAKAS